MSDTTKPALYALTPEAHATVLAALRDYQNHLVIHGAPPATVLDIATNGGTLQAMDDAGIDALCESLNHTGLEFGQIVNLIGDDDSDPFVAAAQQHDLLDEGTLEVDPKTIVSRGGDNGAYVMAWLWVDGDGEDEDEEESDDLTAEEAGS